MDRYPIVGRYEMRSNALIVCLTGVKEDLSVMAKKVVQHPAQANEGSKKISSAAAIEQQIDQIENLLNSIAVHVAGQKPTQVDATPLSAEKVQPVNLPAVDPSYDRSGSTAHIRMAQPFPIQGFRAKWSRRTRNVDWEVEVEKLKRSIVDSKFCSRLLIGLGSAGTLFSANSMTINGIRFGMPELVLSIFASVLGFGCFIILAMASQVCRQQRRRAIPFGDWEARQALPAIGFLYRLSLVVGFCVMAWVIQEATAGSWMLSDPEVRLKFALVGMGLFAVGLLLRCGSVLLRCVTAASAIRG